MATGYKPSCGSGFEGDVWSSTLWKWQYSEAGTTHFTQCQIYFLQGSSPKGCNLWWTLVFREASWQVNMFQFYTWGGDESLITEDVMIIWNINWHLFFFAYAFQRGFEVARWKDVFWHVQEWLRRWVSKFCKTWGWIQLQSQITMLFCVQSYFQNNKEIFVLFLEMHTIY